MSDLSDTTLVERSLLGDHGAFGAIVDRYKHVVCATALGMVGDAALSEDIGQEAFVEAWRNLHQLREPEHLRSWICTIARSRSIDAARRRRRHQPQAEPADRADDRPDPFDELAEKETAALVWAVIERVPESCRSALILFYRRGQSVREVALQLGIDEATAKQRLSRGRKHVRAELERLIGKSLEATRPDRRFTLGVLALLPASGVPPTGEGTTTVATGESMGAGWTAPALLVAGVAGALLAGFVVFESIADGETSPSASEPKGPAVAKSSTGPTGDPSTSDHGAVGPGAGRDGQDRASKASGASDSGESAPSLFSGYVLAEPAGVPCVHSRLWLTEGSAPAYPVGEAVAIAAVTDASGRFELGELEPGTYRLQVSCREARGASGFREVVKTFAVVAPRDDGEQYAIDVPAGFEPAAAAAIDELPPAIAELLGADGQPATREDPRGWDLDIEAADADGDGVVSDEERRIHDEITSYVLNLDQADGGEDDHSEED